MNPRPIQDVITAILTQVPKDINDYESFVGCCFSIANSAKYGAPEMHPFHWKALSEACLVAFGPLEQGGWRIVVADILHGKLDYRDFLPMEIP